MKKRLTQVALASLSAGTAPETGKVASLSPQKSDATAAMVGPLLEGGRFGNHETVISHYVRVELLPPLPHFPPIQLQLTQPNNKLHITMLAFIQEWSPPMGKLEMRRHCAPQHHLKYHLGPWAGSNFTYL